MRNLKVMAAVCPLCGRTYTDPPALSRDGKQYICPDCGTREALSSIGISEAEQEVILRTIHRHLADGHAIDAKQSGNALRGIVGKMS